MWHTVGLSSNCFGSECSCKQRPNFRLKVLWYCSSLVLDQSAESTST